MVTDHKGSSSFFLQSFFFSFSVSTVPAAAIGLALNFAFIFFSAPEKIKRFKKPVG
jgi:hypothetical protein